MDIFNSPIAVIVAGVLLIVGILSRSSGTPYKLDPVQLNSPTNGNSRHTMGTVGIIAGVLLGLAWAVSYLV